MLEIGDALLYTLSAWTRCDWHQFRGAFDDLHIRSLSVGNRVVAEPDSNARLNAARTLDSLGHCDVVFSADGSAVSIGPSVLAALPIAGLPRAVLCGSRSPDSLIVLRRAARTRRLAEVRSVSQVHLSRFAPTHIEVQAVSRAAMAELANGVGVIYEAVPPAWSIASLSGSLERYLQSLSWSQRPDLTWAAVDFSPYDLRFDSRRRSDHLILRRYQDPVRGRQLFRLWRGDESAETDDPSWGRYAVLAESRLTVIDYDPILSELAIPAGVPLPRLMSRAVTLCSGYAAKVVMRGLQKGTGEPRPHYVYEGVPPDVYRVCAEKIGQLPRDGSQ